MWELGVWEEEDEEEEEKEKEEEEEAHATMYCFVIKSYFKNIGNQQKCAN